jgi:hypothetical protein
MQQEEEQRKREARERRLAKYQKLDYEESTINSYASSLVDWINQLLDKGWKNHEVLDVLAETHLKLSDLSNRASLAKQQILRSEDIIRHEEQHQPVADSASKQHYHKHYPASYSPDNEKLKDLGDTDDDGQQDEMWDLQNRLLGKQRNRRKGNAKGGEMVEGYDTDGRRANGRNGGRKADGTMIRNGDQVVVA